MTDYVSKYTLKFNDLATKGFFRAAGAARVLTNGIGKIGIAAGVMTGAVIGATTLFNRATAEQQRLAQSVGTTVGALSGITGVGQTLGLEFDNVVDLVEEMNNKIGEFKTLGELATLEEGLQGVGLAVSDIIDLNPAQQFEKIFKAAAESGDTQQASSSLDMLMGGEASKLLGAFARQMQETGQTFDQIMNRYKSLNNLSEEGARGAIRYSDAFARLQKFTTSLAKEGLGKLGGVLAPVIDRLTNFLIANKEIIATRLDQFIASIADALGEVDFEAVRAGAMSFISEIGTIISKVSDLVGWLGGLGNVAQGLFGAFVIGKVLEFAAAMTPLVVAIGAVPIAIAAVVAAGVLLYRNWDIVKERFNALVERFPIIGNVVDLLVGPFRSIIQIVGIAVDSFVGMKNIALGLVDLMLAKWAVLQKGMSNVMQSIKGTIAGVWESIKTSFFDGINVIIELINKVIRAGNMVKGVFGGAAIAEIQTINTVDSSNARAGAVNIDGAVKVEITGKIDGAKVEANATGSGIVDSGGSNMPLRSGITG